MDKKISMFFPHFHDIIIFNENLRLVFAVLLFMFVQNSTNVLLAKMSPIVERMSNC